MRRLLRWAFPGLTALSLAGFLGGVASWALASRDRARAVLAAVSGPIQKDDSLTVTIEDSMRRGNHRAQNRAVL
jgi:ribosomal protein S28E/S33